MPDYNHAYIGSLVKKAQAGNSDAFAELYGLTYNHIYNYAAHYLKDTYLAQDAVQETYIHALRNIRKINDPSLFIAWINQIAFHTCFDICKKQNANYGLIDPEMLELTEDTNIEHNPEDIYEKNSETESLQKAIDALPFHEQQVIVLRYYNDLKLEDIASVLSISRSTVKRYLASAKEKLERSMKGGDK
ncbi:MAG: sigma-70 family RNA polymerase sigma factor [Lachnospiraceae bacterium]|nr:sigma-70 family RNA polymerase sigma factor [Lachnospiraceae bacterium]